jgi:hypothetical protein
MLFIADWYFPSPSFQTFFRGARVDKSIIRIKSARKWPEPIVFDSGLPTTVPPPLPVLAQLNSPLPKAPEYSRAG